MPTSTSPVGVAPAGSGKSLISALGVAGAVLAATLIVPSAQAAPAVHVATPALAAAASRVNAVVLSAPDSVVAGQSAVVDVTARAGSKCRLTLATGAQSWRSASKKLKRPARNIIQFAWVQSPGSAGSPLAAQVTCTRKHRSQTREFLVNVIGDGSPSQSVPTIQAPVLVATDAQPDAGLGGDRGSPTWGTVQLSGSQWLGGAGVDVVSNGGSTYDCPGGVCQTNGYGIKWQCVELVNRLVMSKGWSGRIWGNAWAIYGNAPAASYDKHPAGDGYSPVPGDIMVWGGSSYGHVAVVDKVEGGQVHFVEQNGSPTGRNSRAMLAGGAPAAYGTKLRFTGYLHARANTPPAPAAQPQTPAQMLQPAGGSNLQPAAPVQSTVPVQGPSTGGSGAAPTPQQPTPPSATITVNTCATDGNCERWNPIWIHSNPAGSSRIADAYRFQQFTARCWAPGRQLTDGNNSISSDDPIQFTSSLWYGVDYNGGRGYVPAVWTTKREDHLGLPAC